MPLYTPPRYTIRSKLGQTPSVSLIVLEIWNNVVLLARESKVVDRFVVVMWYGGPWWPLGGLGGGLGRELAGSGCQIRGGLQSQ